MQGKVTGWKGFAGNIDGKDIDSASVFVEIPLDTTNGKWAKGTASAALRCPNSAVLKRIEHLPVPFEANIEMTDVTDGKGGFKSIVRDVVPVSLAKPTVAARAA